MSYKVTFPRYVFENDVEVDTNNLGDGGFRLGEGSILILQNTGKWIVGGAVAGDNTDYATESDAVAFVWPGPRVDKTGDLYSDTGDPVINYDILKTNAKVKVILPPTVIEYDSTLIDGAPNISDLVYIKKVEYETSGNGEYRFTVTAPTGSFNPITGIVIAKKGNNIQIYVK